MKNINIFVFLIIYYFIFCLYIYLKKIDYFTKLSDNDDNKFKNIVFSSHLSLFKSKILNEHENLKDDYDKNKPCIFFGFFSNEDRKRIINHNSYGLIIWAGSDSMKKINLDTVNKLDRKKFFNLSQSNWISDDLKKNNIEYRQIPWYSITKKKWTPVKKGRKIYIYLPEKNKKFYGEDLFNKIKKKVKYEFIVGDPSKFKKEQMFDLYSQCFIGLRLVKHDGAGATVHELGLMGIKCVHNGDSPSALNYKDIDDILKHINDESKKIGTIDNKLSNKMNNYLILPKDLFLIDSYIK